MVRKVLLSLPEDDLKVIDRAAGLVRETRSAFIRRAALTEARRVPRRPLDDPDVRHAYAALLRRAARREPISTDHAIKARDRGRR